MSDNPYDPPEAPIADERFLAVGGTGTFDLGQCFSEAWDDTWRCFPLWLGVLLVALLLFALSGITIIGIFLVWPVLGWGTVRFYLNMTDQKATFNDLFAGFSNYGTALVGTLVLAISLQILGLIGQSVQYMGQFAGNNELMFAGLVINLFWVFGVMLRLYFGILYLVDQELGPIEALQASWEATRGQGFKLIGLALASAAVVVAGLIALLVGVIPASVMAYLMWTSAYRQIVGRPEPAAAPVAPGYGGEMAT